MTTGATGEQGEGPAGASLAEAWRSVRADGDIQFAPADLPEAPPPPGWLDSLLETLGSALRTLLEAGEALGITATGIIVVLAALAAGLIALLLWRLYGRRDAQDRGEAEDRVEWAPETGEARALLDEADRLAAAGHYDEAAHLLLRRSVERIGVALPGAVEPSSTARDIAALPDLPLAARRAFVTIAERVERSLFALRRLDAQDWHAARAAYADFALGDAEPRA